MREDVDSFNDATPIRADETVNDRAAATVCSSTAQQCSSFAAQLLRTASLLQSLSDKPCVEPSTSERLRSIIAQRRLRADFFSPDLFADPAWDILLELYLAALQQHRVGVTSLCIAVPAPATTALRWIAALVERGLIARRPCLRDGRVTYVELTENGLSQIKAYFERVSEFAAGNGTD